MKEEFNNLKTKLWKLGKYAKNYPSEYIVIPVLDVIEMLEGLK